MTSLSKLWNLQSFLGLSFRILGFTEYVPEMKASKGSKGPAPHHDQWKLSCKMLNHTDGQFSKWKEWPAGWSEWLVISCHARGALVEVVGTSQFGKSTNWPTTSSVQYLLRLSFCCGTHHHSFQPRVENGFHSSFREILRRNCSHPFQLLYTDTWSWLINSYHSTS